MKLKELSTEEYTKLFDMANDLIQKYPDQFSSIEVKDLMMNILAAKNILS